MTMQTDIQTAVVAATGTAYAGRTRVRGLLVIPGASAGSVVLRDGGSSGVTKFSIATSANGEPFSVVIPANGVLFNTDVHATVSNAAVTVMYG
jgi:hypothetical protein